MRAAFFLTAILASSSLMMASAGPDDFHPGTVIELSEVVGPKGRLFIPHHVAKGPSRAPGIVFV